MPAGSAITATPNSDDTIDTALPASVVGVISPYPTVVSAVVAQYRASKKLPNICGSFTNIMSALTKMYTSAMASTESSVRLSAANTRAMMESPRQ